MKNSRLLLPSAILCALLAALAFAATASAASFVGESASPENPAIVNGEEDLLGGKVEYDSTAGTVTATATTRSEPTENPELTLIGGIFSSKNGSCALPNNQQEAEALLPVFEIRSPYAKNEGKDASLWFYTKSFTEGPGPENTGPAVRSVVGTKTTVSATTPLLTSGGFTCGIVGIQNSSGPGAAPEVITFPLTQVVEPSPPAPVVTPAPAAQQPAATPPAPKLVGALSFPKAAAPLKLKRERWTTVRFKVSNPGNAPIGPITIKAKAPKGVHLEPVQVKLPALLPGQTWPATFRIEVTDAAKAKPKIALTATATGLSATGSVVIKPTG